MRQAVHEVSRPRPGRLSLVAVAAISHAITHAATPLQLFGSSEPECQICGQRGHCSADCRKGMVIKSSAVGVSEYTQRRLTQQAPRVAIFHATGWGGEPRILLP